MCDDNNLQKSMMINELIISNILKSLNVRCMKDGYCYEDIYLLIDVVRSHILSIINNNYFFELNDKLKELMISNMLDALDISCVRDSFYYDERDLLRNFIISHILARKDSFKELDNNILKKTLKND